MKKVTLKWWVIVVITAGIIAACLVTPNVISYVKDKKLAVQDSITELNQLLREQFQINQTTVYVLDSLSRSGDSLLWQNKKGERCMIKVTKK
jgi:cell division protein FtsL